MGAVCPVFLLGPLPSLNNSKDPLSNELLWFDTIGLIAWLVKDLGWVLLAFPLAIVAALMALVVEVYQVPLRRRNCPAAVAVHHEALLAWLFGNVVWMVTEFSFDPLSKAGQRFPWNAGPLVGGDEDFYTRGCILTRVIMVCGLLHLLRLYCQATWSAFQRRQMQKDLVWGLVTPEVYCWSFAGPWILKDMCWTLGLLWPSLLCGLLVALLMLDCWRRWGGTVHIAELLWVTCNMIWVYSEHGMKDAERWPREAAASLLVVGLLIAAAELRSSLVDTRPVDAFLLGVPEENVPLTQTLIKIENGYSSSSHA